MTLRTKTVKRLKLKVEVQQYDIDEGRCGKISLCMEKVAIERALRLIDPKGGDHKVRVDAGDVKFLLGGFRYHGHLPRKPKLLLIKYDKERKEREAAQKKGIKFVSAVKPHIFNLVAEQGSKTKPFSQERKEQINEARRKRKAEGRPDNKRYDLRHRVEGLGTV